MDKILVTFYLPSIDSQYDMLVTINMKVKSLINLIQNTIVEETNGVYKSNTNAVLVNSEGKIINSNNIVKFSGLTNGCKVILY